MYASESALFAKVRPEEQALVEWLARRIRAIAGRYASPEVYAPLGVGNHVDHQLVRRAAETAGVVAAYFEDSPYVARFPGGYEAGTASGWGGLAVKCAPHRAYLRKADMEAKATAIMAYQSQFSSFWESPAEMREFVRGLALEAGGGRTAERFWVPWD